MQRGEEKGRCCHGCLDLDKLVVLGGRFRKETVRGRRVRECICHHQIMVLVVALCSFLSSSVRDRKREKGDMVHDDGVRNYGYATWHNSEGMAAMATTTSNLRETTFTFPSQLARQLGVWCHPWHWFLKHCLRQRIKVVHVCILNAWLGIKFIISCEGIPSYDIWNPLFLFMHTYKICTCVTIYIYTCIICGILW